MENYACFATSALPDATRCTRPWVIATQRFNVKVARLGHFPIRGENGTPIAYEVLNLEDCSHRHIVFVFSLLFDFRAVGRHFINDESCFFNQEILFWTAFTVLQVGARGYLTAQTRTTTERDGLCARSNTLSAGSSQI